jgi:hypothetical protein
METAQTYFILSAVRNIDILPPVVLIVLFAFFVLFVMVVSIVLIFLALHNVVLDVRHICKSVEGESAQSVSRSEIFESLGAYTNKAPRIKISQYQARRWLN